ncbi:MAG: hypothetical protein GDA53_07710 [Rhodobacteraceae bacterium]|nr:hypothetical protein [Paracoccaceae bacterium]
MVSGADACANGFTKIFAAFSVMNRTVDALVARTGPDPPACAGCAQNRIDAGATIIGSRRKAGPAHSANLKRRPA